MTSETPLPPNTPFSSLPRKYGGASAEERKQQRRERLLDAAYEVFGRQGYKQTTLRMICAQARMTDRYFYEHFESLDEIFVAVRQSITAELVEMITATLLMPEPDPILKIRRPLAAFFEFMKSDPRRARIILLDAMSFSLTSTEVAKNRLDWYADLIEHGLKARYPNLPPHLNAKLVASGFLGHVTYIGCVWTMQNFDTPIDELVDHASYSWIGLHHWLRDFDAAAALRNTG